MGVWGYENFESDDALSVLGNLIQQIISKVREVFTYESKHTLYSGFGEHWIVANVDILSTLFRHYKIYPDLESLEVSKWKQDYLDTYDRVVYRNDEGEISDFAKNRRAVIEATFDKLYKILEEIISETD